MVRFTEMIHQNRNAQVVTEYWTGVGKKKKNKWCIYFSAQDTGIDSAGVIRVCLQAANEGGQRGCNAFVTA